MIEVQVSVICSEIPTFRKKRELKSSKWGLKPEKRMWKPFWPPNPGDIDTRRSIIILNDPEKNGNPRIFKVSPKLLGMIETLPKTSQTIFNCAYTALRTSLRLSKKRIARNLNNPRLLKIAFHTLRHWKATMEYNKTKDVMHVKELLWHRKLDTTTMYIQIAEHLFQHEPDEFTVKVAKTQEEIKAHLRVGFEWIGEKDGMVFLRKRK